MGGCEGSLAALPAPATPPPQPTPGPDALFPPVGERLRGGESGGSPLPAGGYGGVCGE